MCNNIYCSLCDIQFQFLWGLLQIGLWTKLLPLYLNIIYYVLMWHCFQLGLCSHLDLASHLVLFRPLILLYSQYQLQALYNSSGGSVLYLRFELMFLSPITFDGFLQFMVPWSVVMINFCPKFFAFWIMLRTVILILQEIDY